MSRYATHTQKLADIYRAYEDQCAREGVVDFAELMLRTVEIMRDQPAIREHYRRRFRHILVDEFQDTNRLQYAWLKMFAPLPGSPRPMARPTARRGCLPWATMTKASTPFEARKWAICATSSASSVSSR